jgi:Ser/Thr protein kinase RdoA (MazF antagonist)
MSGMPASNFLPDLERIVRNGLSLDDDTTVEVSEVTRWTNLNHVFVARAGSESLYLKLATERPKQLDLPLPRERIFFEAAAIARFRALSGNSVRIPEVRFVDRQNYLIALSNVGQGRQVLLEIIDRQYPLLVAQALPLGTALGRIHQTSRGMAPFRPDAFEQMLRTVIVDHLLAPGARALFAPHWPAIAARLRAPGECLIHGDLWGKNLLVGANVPPAIVDFEGASIGDPAFDLGTLLAVALIPALEQPALIGACILFSEALIAAYRSAARESAEDGTEWLAPAIERAFLYTGTFLAARGFGPFPYPMADTARERLAGLARSLSTEPVANQGDYCARLWACGAVAEAVM